MNREQVDEDIESRHGRRILTLCRMIGQQPTDTTAWESFVQAVMSLPGVSGDNITRADIEQLTLTLVSRLSGMDTRPECPELCWIKGPHVRHAWPCAGHRHSCEGVSTV